MKKIVFVLLVCALLTGSCAAADYTVTRLTAECIVQENGQVEVTQTVELQVDAELEELVIPVAADAGKVTVSGVENRVIYRDGSAYARLQPEDGLHGRVTVTATYVTDGQIRETDRGQAYEAELVSGLWEQKVERFSFSVVLPKAVAARPTFFGGYRADDVEDVMTVAMEGRAVSGQVRGGLMDRESFTMKMDVPAGYFPPTAARGNAPWQWVVGVMLGLLLLFSAWYWLAFLRSGRLRVLARTMPPESVTAAELPFLLCGGRPDFALLVCHWGLLGYLTVTVNSAGRVLLRRSMDMGTERREEERKLFDLLFGTSDVCEAGGSRYRRAAEIGAAVLRQYWVRRLFDRRSGSPMLLRAAATVAAGLALMSSMILLLPAGGLKWLLVIAAFVAGGACGTAVWYGCLRQTVWDIKYTAVGAAALLFLYLTARLGGGLWFMLPALALCIFAGVATRHGGRRTASGSDLTEQSLGFVRFLGHADEGHLAQMFQRDGQFFFEMLLYAEACGIGRTFARRCSGLQPEVCGFLTLPGKAPASAYEFYLRFAQLLQKMR